MSAEKVNLFGVVFAFFLPKKSCAARTTIEFSQIGDVAGAIPCPSPDRLV